MGQTGHVGWKLTKLTKGTKVGLRECGMQQSNFFYLTGKWFLVLWTREVKAYLEGRSHMQDEYSV